MKQVVSLALLFGAASAYSVNGHLAVANIAQDLLETNNQASLDAAVASLVYLQEYDPELVYREDMYPFIECSTFADDIKYHGGGWQGDFHYIDYPFIDQAGKTTADYPDSTKIATRNLTEGITQIVAWLSQKQGDAYLDSYIYQYIQNTLYPGNPDVAQSYALRLLIHFIGDISQPLHVESRFNDQYPDGDAGGNAFPIPYHYEADELHAVWDKGIYSLRGNIPRPFTNQTYADFQVDVVNPYMSTYDYSMSDPTEVANLDYDMWTTEKYDIAITVYTGAVENQPLSQEYIDTNTPIMENSITLGGYRLAYVMTFIYDPTVQWSPSFLA